jgi:hypothetical protein
MSQIRKFLYLPLAICTLSLSACGSKSLPEPRAGNTQFQSSGARSCLTGLRDAGIKFELLPNKSEGQNCRTIDNIKLLDFGTQATNLGAMTCPLASQFSAWARYAAAPAAKQYFGSKLVQIETMGTYNCRNIKGGRSGRISQHAFGNAVDISAFILEDGRRISVLSGWNGKPGERAFLRRLHESACKRFGTILGPAYNAAHANHFHFDMAQSMKDGSSYCR